MAIFTRAIVGVLLAGAVCISGCAKDAKPDAAAITKLPDSEVQSLNAQHARFEKSEDPPIAAETRYAAGQLAESQRNPTTAIQQYREALKIQPNHLPSLFRLAVVYAQVGSYADAVATWQIYLKETNNDPVAWANLGFCHELAGNTKEAEEAYQQGIAKDPKSNPCRVNYGLMLARAGRTTQAIIQLQAVLPEAQVHYNLGAIHEQQGHLAEAKAEYRKAMELDPNLAEAKLRLAALD
ncbi:MAG: tetratricopeptide repeat protein [Bacillota bacterium]